MVDAARRGGARVRTDEPVESIAVDGAAVEVRTAASRYRAEAVVVTAGAWVGELLPSLAAGRRPEGQGEGGVGRRPSPGVVAPAPSRGVRRLTLSGVRHPVRRRRLLRSARDRTAGMEDRPPRPPAPAGGSRRRRSRGARRRRSGAATCDRALLPRRRRRRGVA